MLPNMGEREGDNMKDTLWAYKAIETRYIGPTNTRGSRCKATAEGHNSITLSWDSDLDSLEMHHKAALALCAKMNWKGKLVAGGTARGYVFVFADRDFKAEHESEVA